MHWRSILHELISKDKACEDARNALAVVLHHDKMVLMALYFGFSHLVFLVFLGGGGGGGGVE